MTLIRCPECSNTISSQSVACPHCGYPLSPSAQPAAPPAAPVSPLNSPPNPLPPKMPPSDTPLPTPSGQSERTITTLLGIGVVVVLGIILLVTCSTSQQPPSATPTNPQVSKRPLQPVTPKTPDTSKFLPIPMLLAGPTEDGRYFLMSHTLSNDGIHEITYLRTRHSSSSDATDTYGKMQLDCELGEIRKSAADTPQHLVNADLGNWYTPAPNSTDRDIFNFICESGNTVVSDTDTTASVDTTTAANTASAEATAGTGTTDTAILDTQDQPATVPATNPAPTAPVPTEPSTPKLVPKPDDKTPSQPVPLPSTANQPDNMSKLIAERDAYTQQITRIIKSNWQLPMTPKFTTVRATFSLAPDGTISNIRVHTSDMYAKSTLTQAIEASSPLPPIPKGAERYFAENSLTFRVNR